jgi:hypothetical protein
LLSNPGSKNFPTSRSLRFAAIAIILAAAKLPWRNRPDVWRQNQRKNNMADMLSAGGPGCSSVAGPGLKILVRCFDSAPGQQEFIPNAKLRVAFLFLRLLFLR